MQISFFQKEYTLLYIYKKKPDILGNEEKELQCHIKSELEGKPTTRKKKTKITVVLLQHLFATNLLF